MAKKEFNIGSDNIIRQHKTLTQQHVTSLDQVPFFYNNGVPFALRGRDTAAATAANKNEVSPSLEVIDQTLLNEESFASPFLLYLATEDGFIFGLEDISLPDFEESFDAGWDGIGPIPSPSFAAPSFEESFDAGWDGT